MAGGCDHRTKSIYETSSAGRKGPAIRQEKKTMPAKIIVSYDGTANEDDAIALGRLLGAANAEVSLAYVRHTHEPDRDRETLAEAEAHELLERGAALFGDQRVGGHVVTDRSTPEGLAALAEQQGADVIVFCSDSHTAKGHVSVGNSRPEAQQGHVALSASASHLIEIATCPVLVVPRGVTVPFGRATASIAAA
jgi:nucleotide-binding universal stress UspA family protein